jgi:FlgD Ig-like domain
MKILSTFPGTKTHPVIFGAILGFWVLSLGSTALAASEGFLPNAGRLDSKVQYYGTSSLVDVFFTADGVVFDIKDAESLFELPEDRSNPQNGLPVRPHRGQALYLTFPGARSGVELIAGEETDIPNSFFFGNNPSNWVSDQNGFRTLTYRNLWQGADLVFTLEDGNLTYEIIGDASVANLEWLGADQVLPTADGRVIQTPYGTLLDSGSSISHDREIPNDNLVFASRGPGALLWSTMIGGSGDDQGTTLATAANGDLIIAGETRSLNFPGTPGAYDEQFDANQDIFVSRFSDEGSNLVWSTYIGTSSYDYVNAIILDDTDNIIIAGSTGSSAFPTTAGVYDQTYNGGTIDAILTKLSNDGSSLVFSTYVGGSDADSFFDLLPDASGNLVCVGYTASTDFPVSVGAYQTAFAGPPYDMTVSILSADGSTLNAGTYFGGSDRDACRGVAIDANGDLFLSGFTFSTDFPATAGAFQTVKGTIDDAALVKMNSDLTTLHWATFLGGDNSERALCVDLDSSGDPVIAGFTISNDFPTTSGALQENNLGTLEAFVAKFNNLDGTRDWVTYMGGTYGEEIFSLVMDDSDNPVVTGFTSSPNFPVNNLGFDDTHNGNEDIFVSRLSADGTSLLWGTFLGDSGYEQALEVMLDSADNPILTGRTSSASFPVSSWAYDQTHNGGTDAILARFDTGNANLSINASSNETACGSSTAVTFTYNPDLPHTPPLRGYSIRIQAPLGLTFASGDISVLSPLVGVNDTFQIIENDTGDFTIDFSFLDQGAGLSTTADLFTINMNGTADGLATVGIASGFFRDEDNHPFDVDVLDTIDISVDCTPPNVPTMDAEPLFTIGTSNTVSWSDESLTDAVGYNVQYSDQPDFSVINGESGFIPGLNHEFTGLTSGNTYYYRVISQDANNQDSEASVAVLSTQDAEDPISSLAALPVDIGATFDLVFNASDAISGLESVELFYSFEGGPFTSAGISSTSPISFTATDGDGTYEFYTIALDAVGNSEAIPGAADAATNVDTTAPDTPTLTAEPLFTAGAGNTVTTSDEAASGAVAYNFQNSQLVDFSVIDAESGPVAALSHEFTGLTDGVIYYYRVTAIDNLNNTSDFSVSVSSTQDASAPVSSVTALSNQGVSPFDVAFTSTDAGVGGGTVELFVNYEGAAFTSFGTFATSPISFTAAQGEGTYGFYTVGTDDLGNTEVDPGSAQTTCVVDLTAPVSSVTALDEFQTVGIFDITVTGSDNLTGVASYELFYSLDAGPWTSAGSNADGNFSFTSPGDGAYEFHSIAVDGVGHSEAAPAIADATTTVDTNGPTGIFAVNGGAIATNNADVTLNMVISGCLEMRFSNDNLTFSEGWVLYDTLHAWTIEASEGEHTVYGEFRDQAGNLLQVTDSIGYDIQAPAAVTYLELDHGHETVNLSWHNPDDSDLDHLEIWRGLLHDGSSLTVYPDYVGGVVPAAPADRAAALANSEWELVGNTEGAVEAFADTVVTRGVYYYEIFAVDIAGNFSAPNGQQLASINYILGDMALAFDGQVAVVDLTTLAASYGYTDGDDDFNKDADVGPTNDFSSTGIPQPDDYVGFDDLMITASNYGVAKSSGKVSPGEIQNPEPVVLNWVQSSPKSFTLRLESSGSALKGLNISADLPTETSVTVTAGDLARNQDAMVFLQNIPAHGLDTGCAMLGGNQGFIGTGDLLVVTLADGADPTSLDLENLTLVLRDTNNQDLEFSFEQQISSVDIPTSFALGRNYPNPFNPMTAISFALPKQENVRLEIYGLDGRRVAVLVNGTLGAGHHEITWTGRDDSGHQVASGVYFYRIRAGEFADVKKMTLMK